MKVVTIVGARPQFVKAAVVSRAMRRADHSIEELLVHTGQHFDRNMSDLFFEQMEIPPPAYHLGIGGGSHGSMTGRMVAAIEEVLFAETPDLVLIYGDTNSTLAGALAASKLHIPLAHVEAGLRSYDRRMPEEINRVLSDHVSDLLFAPTEIAVNNLKSEGFTESRIRQVGDVMYDAALFYQERARGGRQICAELGLARKGFLLATIHRQENTDHPVRLKAIVSSLQEIAQKMPVVLPLHPRTADRLKQESLSTEGLRVIEPVGYLEMVQLEEQAAVVATDSGGVQKEAFFFRTPTLLFRDRTEWRELVDGGYALLVDANREDIVAGFYDALGLTPAWEVSLFGDGHAAEQIVSELALNDANS